MMNIAVPSLYAAGLLVMFPFYGMSQGIGPSDVQVTITSSVSHAKVFLDDREIGTTPLVGYAVTPGAHTLCVVAADHRTWGTNLTCEQIEVADGTEPTFHIVLPRTIRITSEPFGAHVFYRDSVYGETPFIISTKEDVGSVRLLKEGYNEVSLIFEGSTRSLHGVLRPQQFVDPVDVVQYLEKEESETIRPLVITASSAVLTGVAAAYWKLRADDLYSHYRSTGDRTQLDRIRRLDIASGVAFGLSQVSLAMLTYFLLSR